MSQGIDWAPSSPHSQDSLRYTHEATEMFEHSPAERRALIVEDETLFAMSLAVDMQGLGFANCDLAATGQDAFLKAMEDLPELS